MVVNALICQASHQSLGAHGVVGWSERSLELVGGREPGVWLCLGALVPDPGPYHDSFTCVLRCSTPGQCP